MTDHRVDFTDAGTRITLPWSRTWPPPDLLYVVHTPEQIVLVDPSRQTNGTILRLIVEHGATLHEQVAVNQGWSSMTDEDVLTAMYQPTVQR